MTAKEHNKMIGIFLMIHGGLQVIVMIMLALLYGGIGSALLFSAQREEEQIVGLAVIGVLIFILLVFLIVIIPQLLGGWKMLKENRSARTWGIIGSIVSLLFFPLGTAVGVYGLWFLFGEGGKRFYLGGSQPQNMFNPPPPNNWQ